MKLILIDLLIKSGCNSRGDITLKKKELEHEKSLLRYIERASEEPKVLAETLEALIAAIYPDGGYEVINEIIGK